MRRHIRVGLQEVLAKLDGLKLPERGWRVKRKDGVK
jgi:hypothetical protein